MSEDVAFSPAVEISESDGEILVTAELPGISKDEVNIEIANNVLTLHGKKTHEREEKERQTYIYERTYGSFRRHFKLGTAVDERK